MAFLFQERGSDSPFLDKVWRTTSGDVGPFMSVASSQWEMVLMRQYGRTYFVVRGPETFASTADCPPDAEFFGMHFKLGTFMPRLPARLLLNGGVEFPDVSSQRVRIVDTVVDLPDFENADTFVDHLVRQGLLARDPLVDAALQGRTEDLSSRSVQRRFLQATGLTHRAVRGIERARKAALMLWNGATILDTVEQAGFTDQPHMTRALKRLAGQTPRQIMLHDLPMSLA